MVEIVTQIKSAEQEAEEIRRGTRQKNRQLADEAVAAAKRQTEAKSQEASTRAAGVIAEAESGAAAYLEEQSTLSKAACGEVSVGAKAKMDAAASFIVERIVQGL